VARVSRTLTSTAEVIRQFLSVNLAIDGREGEEGEVAAGPVGASSL
jgi:RNA 3'-terminal phosphate cyclase (ATP)